MDPKELREDATEEEAGKQPMWQKKGSESRMPGMFWKQQEGQ